MLTLVKRQPEIAHVYWTVIPVTAHDRAALTR